MTTVTASRTTEIVAPGPCAHQRSLQLVCLALLCVLADVAVAHAIGDGNARFIEGLEGSAPIPFFYLGAKHMVTGVDHLLYLVGVVFFLSQPRQVLWFVSLFALGHSLTLLGGVLLGWSLNTSLVDAVIGLSIVYKAFENLGGFARWSWALNPALAVFLFGLMHGLGLAGRVRALALSEEGLVTNLISFNLGVELGQGLALLLAYAVFLGWRKLPRFAAQAWLANTALMTAGFVLLGYHLLVWRLAQ